VAPTPTLGTALAQPVPQSPAQATTQQVAPRSISPAYGHTYNIPIKPQATSGSQGKLSSCAAVWPAHPAHGGIAMHYGITQQLLHIRLCTFEEVLQTILAPCGARSELCCFPTFTGQLNAGIHPCRGNPASLVILLPANPLTTTTFFSSHNIHPILAGKPAAFHTRHSWVVV